MRLARAGEARYSPRFGTTSAPGSGVPGLLWSDHGVCGPGTDATVAHGDLPVGVGGDARIMGDDDQAGTSGAHRVQEYLHGPLGGQGVQGAGGLVGEEEVRVGHQCPRDGGPLRLPARELGGALVQVLAQPQLTEGLAGLGQSLPARGARQKQRDGDVVQGGEVRQELAELEDEAELLQAQAAAGRLVEGRDVLRRIASVVVDASGVGHEDPGHDVQER